MVKLIQSFKITSLPVFFWIFYLLLMPFDAFGQSRQRDMKGFSKGPTFDLNGQFLGKADAKLLELRTFVKTAWEKRKKTRFTVVTYSREGSRASCNFYLARDSALVGRIVSECISEDCAYISKSLCAKEKKTVRVKVYDRVVVRTLELEQETANKQPTEVIVLMNSKTAQERVF